MDSMMIIITSVCVILLAAISVPALRMRKQLLFYKSILEKIDSFAYISYDKKRHIVNIEGNIKAITNIEIKPGNLQKKDYDKIREILYLKKDNFEDDIYTTIQGDKWYRLASHESNNIEYITIRDITEYMHKINTIDKLRYYDSLTGLLNKQATTDMLRRMIEKGYGSLAIAHFTVTGLEKLASFEDAITADEIITKLASTVKGFENPQKSIFAGRTENNGITLVLSNKEQNSGNYGGQIEFIYRELMSDLKKLSENARQHLKVYCGYTVYDTSEDEKDTGKMLSAAEFAAFSAGKNNSTEPIKYDPALFEESANEFKKTQIFNEIISNSLIDYHFQPIVNAHTGDIYGYEALMRPREIDGLRLNPLELLDIAEEQNMLERVESITFNMTLKALSEHQDVFHNRRLFVNSVSCVTLTDAQYEKLVNTYSELFPKLVVEITEANKLSDNIIPVLDKYFKPHKAHVALDDYGAGYSNDKTLLDVMPNYIKIDRSLIIDINDDKHKKQLVSNVVSYASSHGVFSLAEGVETEAELETLIFLGVDLIQGYFTCRPLPIFMHEIESDIRELIVKYSVMHAKRDDRIFEVKDNKPVDLVNLAVFGYTDITVKCSSVEFYGNADTKLNMRIVCPDNTNILMKLKDVNIHNDEYPALTIGDNSEFTLCLEGENTLSNQGIRVTETSTLHVNGDGNLTIIGSFFDGVCLGGNCKQTFGVIKLNTTGTINLENKSDDGVCLGGGIGTSKSSISMSSGQLNVHARGDKTLGVGALSGDVSISMDNCKIDADISGINAVAIGSITGNADIRSGAAINITGAGNNCCLIGTQHGFAKIILDRGLVNLNASGMNVVCIGGEDGSAHIESSADLTIVASGDDCCIVGTLAGDESDVIINDGIIKFTCNAKRIAAIGTMNGQCNIELNSGVYELSCEGNSAICVGNHEGKGNILIGNIIMSAVEQSQTRQNIATNSGTVTISGGNIYTNSTDPLNAISPYGAPLCCYVAEGYDKPLNLTIKDNDATYRYSAKPGQIFEGMYIYVPEGSVKYRRLMYNEE